MKKPSPFAQTFLSVISLLFFAQLSHAQEFRGTSSPVRMDFGYPKLQVMDDILYEDEDDDNLLTAGEAMLISFSIRNEGDYTANDVRIRPEELNRTPGLDLPDEIEIGEIKAGETKRVQIGIGSDERLLQGTASFVFRIMENNVFQNLSVPYVVNTRP